MARMGLRSRLPRWPITAAVIGLVVIGGAAAVAKWPHAWWWLITIAAAAAALVPPALAAVSQAVQRQQEIARAARSGLQGIAKSSGDVLPSAATANLEARVHRTILPIPYVRRDEEKTVSDHLYAGHPVLLIGSSMVGKTKMASRIIAENFGSWPVVIPDNKTALADLEAKDVTIQRAVIWLDDIDRLIVTGGISDGALRRLSADENVIIGTIRAGAYDQLRPSEQLRPPEWDVLSIFEHVFINRNLTHDEQDRLAQSVADPEIRARITTVGLGEYVGAAVQIAEALKLGAAGADSTGYALVLGAADWRRCGLTRPIPESLLQAVAGSRLDQRGQAKLNDQEAFNAGLAWATREINPNVSLLRPTGTASYVVYDYALDLLSKEDHYIPDATWDVVIANAEVSELVDIGYNAEVTYHLTETAIRAFRESARVGDDDTAPLAWVNLGILLEEQGDMGGARDAFRHAIDSGHPDRAVAAWDSLGNLLKKQGDVDGARDAFRHAIDSGHPDHMPKSQFNLGALLAEQGDVDGARDAYRHAIDSGHRDAAPRATVGLGVMLAEQGDVDGAREAFRHAIDSGHPDEMPRAWVRLGILLVRQEDVDGAREAFRHAIDSGQPDEAPIAWIRLGILLAEQGDVDGAREAFQHAIDSGHSNETPKAWVNLGALLAEQGDVDGARDAYQHAIESGHRDAVPRAWAKVGDLLAEQGDVDGVRIAYQHAIESGDPDVLIAAADLQAWIVGGREV